MFESFFKWYYRFRGWTLGENLPPEMKKCVVIIAPHTSAWDFVFGAGAKLLLPLDAIYLAKKELFRWPLKNMFLRLGGVPVDRGKHAGLTEAMIDYIKTHDVARVVFPAEGTRRRVTKWKKGFYYAALGAGVPIAMAYIDFGRKKAGIGPAFMPSGDLKKDFAIISDFYRGITACRPEKFALPEA
jgi:1-acyl-sn-glycerol-3-phosphate acyltransferase